MSDCRDFPDVLTAKIALADEIYRMLHTCEPRLIEKAWSLIRYRRPWYRPWPCADSWRTFHSAQASLMRINFIQDQIFKLEHPSVG